ncbi:MAG: transposase family protein [Desulfovibrio sp.]|nr:transposase family protein [Desulfovibrio sp.]
MIVDMSLPGVRVVRVLEKLRLQGRLPQRIKVDNGPEFSGDALDSWAFEHGVQIEFTRPGKPTDNGHIINKIRRIGIIPMRRSSVHLYASS